MSVRPRRTFIVAPDEQTRSEFELELLEVSALAWARASSAVVAGSAEDILRAGIYLRVIQAIEDSMREARDGATAGA